MPNHVKNVLKFHKLKSPEDIKMIVNLLTKEDEDSIAVGERTIDFDRIIPEPRLLDECPPECRLDAESKRAIATEKDRPWFDWYNWHLDNWGTKWNAYDGYIKVGASYVTFVFSTAWSYPEPIIEQLKLMGYDIEYKFADEDYR